MSSMHEGLLVMDQDEVVQYCSVRTAELLGVEQRLLLGAGARSVLAQVRSRMVAPDSVLAQWKRALRSPENRPTLEIELTQPSRSIQAEVFTVADSTTGRRSVGVVLRDVTAERDLVRTKDELVSVVSHELRTPLASVVGFAELLRTRELKEAQRQQFLTVILEEGRRLTALINDFLDLQRMESGHQEIAPRPVELAAFVEQCVAAAGMDDARPIELDLADDLPAVRADADRIRQVITNLLSNARKYSPAGGAIRVSAHEANGQVIVNVQDKGLGLPAEALPRLFEKFYRVDNSDRRSITGTGLGLAISRKIVDAHGGRIWAESAGLGQGSCFSFSLPLADARSTSGDVLIVEDDAGFARLLEAELTGHGLSSVWVPSAEEALDQLEVETPKAIVLDLLLPRLQGETFLRRLRQGNGAQVPVLVVTVKDLSQEERSAMEQLGVVAMLRKQPAVGATAAEIITATLSRSGVRAAQGLVA
jgi:signal transduction histidine kinase